MRKLLLQLDSSKLPSVFDRVVAYDGGADEVMSYGGITPGEVRDLVYGCIFTSGTSADSGLIVNNFSIMAATKNGSGSQTANGALLRAFFKMGIPVSGKNLFPSN